MASHKSLKRICSRAMDEIRSTKEIASLTSWKEAIVTFRAKVDIQIMNRNGYREPEKVKRHLMKKHAVMLTYFDTKYSEYLDKYTCCLDLPEGPESMKKRIWVCWWQGLGHAPDLVKKCVDSIVRNACGYEVTVITEANYKDYVHIPAWAEEKFKKGIISRTHYSDILRLSLLAEHGGMWLDATFFCTEPILGEYMQLPIWTIKRPDYRHGSVACGEFATYSLACSYEKRWIFATIRDLVLHYWEESDTLVDYLFLDYLFVLAQRKDPRIAEAFDAIRPNNPRCDDLCFMLDQAYDADLWEELRKQTALFKLTWKQNFMHSNKNKDTFFAKLTRGEL